MRFPASAMLTLLVASVLGCSSEPTSDEFEAFANELLLDHIHEERPFFENSVFRGQLTSVDVRKTDSLTTPFVGAANFSYVVGPLPYHHRKLKDYGYSLPCQVHGTTTLTFGWRDGEWKYSGGVSQQTTVEFPNANLEDSNVLRIVGGEFKLPQFEISQTQFDEGRVFSVSKTFVYKTEEWKREFDITD